MLHPADRVEVDHCPRPFQGTDRVGNVVSGAEKTLLLSREEDKENVVQKGPLLDERPGDLDESGNTRRVVIGTGVDISVLCYAQMIVVRSQEQEIAYPGRLIRGSGQDADNIG